MRLPSAAYRRQAKKMQNLKPPSYPTSKSDAPSAAALCDRCDGPMHLGAIEDAYGEFVCANCDQNAAEAAYERQQERDLESPPESAREEQLRTWEEHQMLHRR